jgi:hypothetical protein
LSSSYRKDQKKLILDEEQKMENNNVSGIVAKPKLLFICLLVLTLLPISAYAVSVDLGTAGSFGALAGSGVTNSVAGTIINGDVGSFPTPAIVGLLPADVNGILYPAAGAVVEQAQLDLTAAYNAAAGAPEGNNVSGVDLSGRTLDPNIYVFNTTASFSSGNLTLDADGNSSAQWIFKIGTTLTTAADFNVALINGAEANNVFWQVGTSATIGIDSNFAGSILAMDSITFNGGGTLNGRALARNAHVTISTAMTISVPDFVPGEANVPYAIDQNQADANMAIIGAGLIVGTITNAYSNTVAAGNVISQDPAGGTAAAGGSAVDLVISLGRPVVPDVVGQTQEDAIDAITAVDLTVGTVTLEQSDTVGAGLVISQSPVGSTVVNIGIAVNMVISLGHAVLVYKVTTPINPMIDYEDVNGLRADVVKDNLFAYVVFDVNTNYAMQIDVNDANGNPDANNNPTAILFGKDGTNKFKITLGGSKPDTFVNISTFGEANSIKSFEVTNKRNTFDTEAKIGFGDSNAATGFDIETDLLGKNMTTDIGIAGKFSVAKSLKGQVWFEAAGRFVDGWGNAKATLDSKLTKDANKNNRTVEETVANIQTTVLSSYTTRTVLPIP